jgi:prepilin-type processing-associated H-X9-DG protein
VIPLMWDHANRDSSGVLVHNHPVQGGNVLYMDGSVRYTNFAEGIPDGIHLSMLVEPF